jgi:hypothetical protein
MASINMAKGTSTGKAVAALRGGHPVRTQSFLVDLAAAATAKGSALAAADVIQCIQIPAYTAIMAGGVRILEVADVTGDNKFKLGIATSDAAFVASNAGSFNSTFNGQANSFIFTTAATTVNLTLQSFTASVPTTGVAAVWVTLADLSDFPGSNINATAFAGEPQA